MTKKETIIVFMFFFILSFVITLALGCKSTGFLPSMDPSAAAYPHMKETSRYNTLWWFGVVSFILSIPLGVLRMMSFNKFGGISYALPMALAIGGLAAMNARLLVDISNVVIIIGLIVGVYILVSTPSILSNFKILRKFKLFGNEDVNKKDS